MNIAGTLVYAHRVYDETNWKFLRERVVLELGLPYNPLPELSEDPSSSLLNELVRSIPVMSLADMMKTRRIGLFTIDDNIYRGSTERLNRVELPDGVPDGGVWLETLLLTEGQRLIAPQLDVERAGLYLVAPVAEGADLTRIVALDTGFRVGSAPETGSIPAGKCDRGVDGELNWVSLPGTCQGHCEPDGWVAGSGPAELTGCSCF